MAACQNSIKIKTDDRLLGSWKMFVIDNDSKNIIDSLTVVYKKDGIVSYESKGPYTYADGSTKEDHTWTEKYYLTDKQTIVTIDEESNKTEVKSTFVSDNKLQLIYEGVIQVLTKIE